MKAIRRAGRAARAASQRVSRALGSQHPDSQNLRNIQVGDTDQIYEEEEEEEEEVMEEGEFSAEPNTASDVRLLEPETLNLLTNHIKMFSETMNTLLSVMACDNPPRVRKEKSLLLLSEAIGYVEQTAADSRLDWSGSVLPCAWRLQAVISEWRADDAQGPRSPDGFAESADALLQLYTREIATFLAGESTEDTLEEQQQQGSAMVSRSGSFGDLLPDSVMPSSQSSSISLGGGLAEGETRRLRDRALHTLDGSPYAPAALMARAKAFGRYAKEVIGYMDKKAALEVEHAKRVIALGRQTLDVLSEFGDMPCFPPVTEMIKAHAEEASRLLSDNSGPTHFLHVHALSEARNAHEKTRKQWKETWLSELRKLQDSQARLAKTKLKYTQAATEWEKSLGQRQKEEGSKYRLKLDKRSREEQDARTRLDDSRKAYDQAVFAANAALQDVTLARQNLIVGLTNSLFSGAETLHKTLHTMSRQEVEFAQLAQGAAQAASAVVLEHRPLLVLSETLCTSATPVQGSRANAAPTAHDQGPLPEPVILPQPFSFETYNLSQEIQDFLSQSGEKNRCLGGSTDPSEPSPPSSPKINTPPRVLSAHDIAAHPDMHAFVKYNVPGKCKHCKHACYFHAVNCTKCGIVCHKKCTEMLEIPCKQAPIIKDKVSNVFGSPLAEQLPELIDGVPIIVIRLTDAIERNGIDLEGIYRLSGVKSRVERICAEFELSPRNVFIEEEDPHVLAAVLKLYFRQLPEPVVPSNFTQKFLDVARIRVTNYDDIECEEVAAESTRKLCDELPEVNYNTLAYTIAHLKRVSSHSIENKMKPSNLGIVFGPTILRNNNESLDTLMDMPLQTTMIELMITHCEHIFQRYFDSRPMQLPSLRDESAMSSVVRSPRTARSTARQSRLRTPLAASDLPPPARSFQNTYELIDAAALQSASSVDDGAPPPNTSSSALSRNKTQRRTFRPTGSGSNSPQLGTNSPQLGANSPQLGASSPQPVGDPSSPPEDQLSSMKTASQTSITLPMAARGSRDSTESFLGRSPPSLPDASSASSLGPIPPIPDKDCDVPSTLEELDEMPQGFESESDEEDASGRPSGLNLAMQIMDEEDAADLV